LLAQGLRNGDLAFASDGARKVRWIRRGQGKRAGVRVIYFNLQAKETVLLVAIYAKADIQNLKSTDIDRSK
jgi:hypothetical protein